jgi:hypothetical protein
MVPFRIKPARGQVPEYSSEEPSSIIGEQSWYVLEHDPSGLNFANNSDRVGPEVAFVGGAQSAASERMRLAGKASANNVNWLEDVMCFDHIISAQSGSTNSRRFRVDRLYARAIAFGSFRLHVFASKACGVGHMRRSPVNLSDIVVAPHLGPVLREHRPAIGINFDLPLGLEPGSLKPQIEAADPCEERSHGHDSRARSNRG